MSIPTSHAHATFCWVDLITKDTASAKAFYGGLFGWTFQDLPDGGQSMGYLGDQPVAALVPVPSMPSYWNNYVAVDDVDAAVKRADGAGGKLIQPPFDIADLGRAAVVVDPAGAPLCFWQAGKHAGTGAIGEAGALTWNELYTPDPILAGRFYAEVLGWRLDRTEVPGIEGTYTRFELGSARGTQKVGGMRKMPAHMHGAPSHWLCYFAVADLDATLARATELGGRVAAAPIGVAGLGRVAIVQDPHDAPFAVLEKA